MRLVTLEQAAAQLGAVSVPMLRARVRRGELPAIKAGRGYLVAIDDLVRLYTPRAVVLAPPRKRETPKERIERQLRKAGIA